ncbi:sodium-dependent transporter [Anaerosporobacter faecicola]|uniref:sodium-dependent transporter n=1 Tax=Anaerosporobacter faecicola TaxID=2718714 RepID=UPI00143C46F8|nr:sodium-dependent transporter [Anaerosporobacter faecicola]
MEREKFKSRLGFILLSAGCAIGIGNVWRFPYVVGNSGGGVFVLFYLFFLFILGLPIMTMEFAVGRASRKSAVKAFQTLEKEGHRWHYHGYAAMIGNYLLMMFYTTVSGWMLNYFVNMATGKFVDADAAGIKQQFADMLGDPKVMTFWMIVVVVLGFAICSLGLQKGVEKITKIMMLALLAIMVVLAVVSMMLKGGQKGLAFYLIPDLHKMKEIGIGKVIVSAMNQAFFTLSLGIGSMAIFGSYLGKERTLLGESINIAFLDTFVAIVAGLIIFPACFAFGVNPDSGPSLIFITLPNIFNAMPGGRFWGSCFFLFMAFASLSTVIAVFENLMSSCMDLWGFSRKKSAILNGIFMCFASMPCVLGFNLLSEFQPLGAGTTILDLEDFIVSNLLLPIGSLIFTLFCVSRYGWGFENYRKEVNEGKGLKIPRFLRGYCRFVLPVIIIVVILNGLLSVF